MVSSGLLDREKTIAAPGFNRWLVPPAALAIHLSIGMAIHGRLLTAWSVAGILGPVAVNYIREFQLAHGVPPDQAYNTRCTCLRRCCSAD